MGTLYERLDSLCKERGIKGGRMCADLGISKSLMTDLKSGRKKTVSAPTAQKIASYFGVSVGYLLGQESKSADDQMQAIPMNVLRGIEKEKPLINDDEELTEYVQMLKTRPECRMLFQLSKNATKEDVEAAVRIIEALRNK